MGKQSAVRRKSSHYKTSSGDEAGTRYGVTSHGAVVTPETPDGVSMHQSYKEAQNVLRHLPAASPRAGSATPVAGARRGPVAVNRAVLLHAIAKQND